MQIKKVDFENLCSGCTQSNTLKTIIVIPWNYSKYICGIIEAKNPIFVGILRKYGDQVYSNDFLRFVTKYQDNRIPRTKCDRLGIFLILTT